MKSIFLIAAMLTACSQEAAQPSLVTGTFAGEGRDRLCIVGKPDAYRAGLIAYGQGDANCSAAGRLEQAGAGWVLIPKGEGRCRIPMEIKGSSVRTGQPPAACAYYCGPGTSLAGKSYNRSDMGAKAVDFAGASLC